MMPLASIVDWAPAASAALAAVASGAAWKSALTTGRVAREARSPLLVMQPMFDPRTNAFQLRIENVGGGVARQVFFYLAYGGTSTADLVPAGFLRPGEGADFEVEAKHEPGVDAKAVVIANDAWGTMHAWRMDGKHRIYSDNRWRLGGHRDWQPGATSGPTGVVWYFGRFYPEVRLDDLDMVDSRLTRRSISE